MTHLRLAEGKPDIKEFYLPYPTKSGIQYIREDMFDDMSNSEFNEYLNALESAGMSEGLHGTMGNKASRQARRQQRADKKEANTEIKKAKAEGIRTGTYQPGGALTNIIGDITDTAQAYFTGKSSGDGGGDVATKYIETKAPEAKAPDKIPLKTSTLPKWVLPVGIGAGALLLLFVFTRKKK